MKLLKMVLALLTVHCMQALGANRLSRFEAGLPGRPELPAGSYFDTPGIRDCSIGMDGLKCTNEIHNVVSMFSDPFTSCPQNGCYDLVARGCPLLPKNSNKGICCYDTCSGLIIKDR